ncbi:MAG: hypothetical protein LBM20_07925 [Rikenellaceae bacterium]|jgi:hypothetical protein|nr:hypothetical protein [Rikenellaceae bacterium]
MNNKENQLIAEELQKLRTIDFSQLPGYEKASDVLAREVGAPGTPEREEFDAKAREWFSCDSMST